MRTLIKKLVIGAVALVLFIAPALPAAAETASDADCWEFVGEIYLWGADIVGVYGIANLNPKWYLTYYADVGTGESDLTWQASASISYRFDKFDTVLGYRYLDFEFDDDAELIDNLNISGPFVGVKFRF